MDDQRRDDRPSTPDENEPMKGGKARKRPEGDLIEHKALRARSVDDDRFKKEDQSSGSE